MSHPSSSLFAWVSALAPALVLAAVVGVAAFQSSEAFSEADRVVSSPPEEDVEEAEPASTPEPEPRSPARAPTPPPRPPPRTHAPVAPPPPAAVQVQARVRPRLLESYEPEIAVVEPAPPAVDPPPDEATAPPDVERLVLSLVLNGAPPRDVFVVRRDGVFFVREEDAVGTGLDASKISGREAFDDVSHVMASRLGEVSFDEQSGTLTITAAAKRFPTTVVDFGRRRPREMEAPMGDASLFFNYAASFQDLRPSFSGELGATVGPAFLTSTFTATLDRGFARGLTQVILDDPKRRLRWTAGDAWARAGSLGGGALVGGLQLARRFELDPYFVRHPLLAYETEAMFASTMDVYVNGNLVGSRPVGPGPVRVENLSAAMGLGDTRIVLRDDFGRQRELARSHYLSSGILSQGVDDFALTAGFERRRYGLSNFDYADPVVLGFYRRGLTNHLTVGLRGEGSLSLASGGATVSARLPSGELSLAGAASVRDGRAGWAASGLYTFLSRHIGASAHARLSSTDYATVGQLTPQDTWLDAGATLQLPLSRGLSLSTQASFLARHERSDELRGSLLVSSRLNSRISLHATATATHSRDRGTAYEGFLSLHASLGHRTSVSGWHRQSDTRSVSGAEISSPLPAGSGLGYRVRTQRSDHTLMDGRFDYQGQYGRAHLQLGYDAGRPRIGGGVSGGLVLIGGDVYASRPVDQAFALIRLPGAPDVRGYVNNQEVGRTNADGDLLVTRLLPYHLNRLSISADDLPMDATLSATERAVVPRYRAGGVVQFGVRRLRAARGRLLLRREDEAFPPSYGELVLDVGERVLRSPLGREGEFEIDDAPAGRFAARALHDKRECHFWLDLPPGREEDGILELGEVECREKESM